MHGRSSLGLLAISLLILPVVLFGQSEPVDDSPELSLRFPHRVQKPAHAPATSLRRRLPIATGPDDFATLSRAAGTIFSGAVIAIARRPSTSGQTVDTVAITFHVENAIRGASPGEALTISQWTGLWSSGQRYRVGERVLLFLYPPSKLGLTSCVAAPMGRFSVDSLGRVQLSAQHLSAFRTDPVLGGKSRVSLRDFALAVQRASEEE